MPKLTRDRTTKALQFTSGDYPYTVHISAHDDERTIYNAFDNKAPGTGPLLITDEYGNKLILKYHHLKTAHNIVVQRAASTSSRAAEVVETTLDKIVAAWRVRDAGEILPVEWMPRALNAAGEKATSEDVALGEVGTLDPLHWGKTFAVELLKLSKNFSGEAGRHQAMDLLVRVARDRQRTAGAPNQYAVEFLPSDIKKAVGLRLEELRVLASEGLEVATFAGGLREAVEAVEEEMAAREGDEEEEDGGEEEVGGWGGEMNLAVLASRKLESENNPE